ncbi:MAG: succinate dehydrogenase assembly factor 2 [Magnetococcales bacterium]|nr:succinate dehydrogenase assembly factor 2 [Magnetococcales bacterium]
MLFPEVPLPRTLAQRHLVHAASRRPMVEMERVLHRFLVAELIGLDDFDCERMIALLDNADADLLDWMAGVKPLPEDLEVDALSRLLIHARDPGVSRA